MIIAVFARCMVLRFLVRNAFIILNFFAISFCVQSCLVKGESHRNCERARTDIHRRVRIFSLLNSVLKVLLKISSLKRCVNEFFT